VVGFADHGIKAKSDYLWGLVKFHTGGKVREHTTSLCADKVKFLDRR